MMIIVCAHASTCTVTFGIHFSPMNAHAGSPWGVTSTPAIDTTAGFLYCVSTLKESGGSLPAGTFHYYHQLWRLNLTTGAATHSVLAEQVATCPTPGTLCTPAGTNNGWISGPSIPASTADDAVGGTLYFQVLHQVQRCGLSFIGGNLVVAFAGYDDIDPWHGWILGFSPADFSPAFVFCTTPNGNGAGVWGAGYK